MTQDEIIEMAREASFTNHSTFEKCLVCNPDSLLHFANLVAAKEREACAKLVDYWEAREGEHADAIRARGEQHG